jgi:hypothetical protein
MCSMSVQVRGFPPGAIPESKPNKRIDAGGFLSKPNRLIGAGSSLFSSSGMIARFASLVPGANPQDLGAIVGKRSLAAGGKRNTFQGTNSSTALTIARCDEAEAHELGRRPPSK